MLNIIMITFFWLNIFKKIERYSLFGSHKSNSIYLVKRVLLYNIELIKFLIFVV